MWGGGNGCSPRVASRIVGSFTSYIGRSLLEAGGFRSHYTIIREEPHNVGGVTPRTSLLDAAATEFAAKGFEGASFASIGAQLGKARSYVQHYVSTKADLAREIVAASFVDDAFIASTKSLTGGRRQLSRFCEVAAERYATDCRVRAAARLMSERPDLFGERNPFDSWRRPLEQVLSETIEDGQLAAGTDVTGLAEKIVAGFAGYGFVSETTGHLSEMPSKVVSLVDDLLRAHAA